jgi:hypothetical protein
LFSYGDIQKIKHVINKKEGHEQQVANIHLSALLRFVETEVCRRIPLLDKVRASETIHVRDRGGLFKKMERYRDEMIG